MYPDLKLAARQLRKTPGFTIVAVLTLALGIGINTGIFSAFKGVVLRPLAGVPDSRDLVMLHWTTRGGDKLPFSYVELREFQQRVRTLSAVEATGVMPFSLDDRAPAQRLWGEFVTGGHHAMLGVQPFLGRLLQPDDDRFPGSPVVAVLSHRIWRNHFGGNPAVVGRAIRLNGQACTIVGVAQPEFVGTTVGFALDVFVPVAAAEHLRPFGGNGTDLFTRRDSRSLAAIGRVRPGVSPEQAEAEIAAIGASLAREYTADYDGKTATLVSILKSPFGAQTYVSPMFGMMLGMTALVLVIMCANLANLLLARAAARSHETAIRLAIGAGRFRLIRQFLTECLLLSLLGGGLGALLASTTPDILRALWPDTLRVPFQLNAEPDATVFVFALTASLASALLFGVVPAVQSSRASVLSALKAGPASRRHLRTWGRNVLVVAQIAVAVPLLVTAGLLLRSAQRQKHADFGFPARQIALMSIDLRPNGYDEERGLAFCERMQREISLLPQVEAVSLANQLPLQTVPRLQSAVQVPGYERPANEETLVLFNTVTPGYLATLQIPLLSGRDFTAADRADTPRVALVNDTMARRYWPGQNPIGRTFEVWGHTREVIGVVPDVKYLTAAESPRPYFYLPHSQAFTSEMILQVRTSGDPQVLIKPVLNRIAQLDPALPVFGVETMNDYLEFALSLPSFAANGLLLSGALGLALTAFGLFGTVSYMVTMRTREIGVRMALGASQTDTVRLVVQQGLWLALGGATIGVLAALACTWMVRGFLFETATTDPVTFALVLAVVGATTLLACWWPARRATRINPIEALRAE